MKLQLMIISCLILHVVSPGKKAIKTTTTCTDEVLFKTPGSWFTSYGGLLDNGSEYIPINKAQLKEITNRMDAIRQMMFDICTEPMGVDVGWHHTIGTGSFGKQAMIDK